MATRPVPRIEPLVSHERAVRRTLAARHGHGIPQQWRGARSQATSGAQDAGPARRAQYRSGMAFELRAFGRLIKRSLRFLGGTPAAPTKVRRPASASPTGRTAGSYPGDFHGVAPIHYSPKPDGQPDPGEIVWSWVPFEEDHSRGKDRPVLLVARDGQWLLGLMLTSKDHDNGNGAGDYVDIGVGPWDPQRRPSEVKLDRIIRVSPSAVRREGAILDKATFQTVSRSLRTRHGWN